MEIYIINGFMYMTLSIGETIVAEKISGCRRSGVGGKLQKAVFGRDGSPLSPECGEGSMNPDIR